ncbi:SIR2 family NAD-dependent protein deacylase [Micrococcoides hystricis]|uniref:protein acetyllysine N-acetyltransferase n=1 Tax=Micrococcoides hystricis TaxID=1572761 RepID=A0ABV6P9K1_9MICC
MAENVFASVEQASAAGGLKSEGLTSWVRAAEKVVVLSGAGMSAESGVPTFRDAHTGFWQHYDVEQLATADAWWANPRLVYSWYLWRARMVRSVSPNAGHQALARWARKIQLFISTQNVDDLHERAGSEQVSHLHGSLYAFRCDDCAAPATLPDSVFESVAPTGSDEDLVMVDPPSCADCARGTVRPDIVFFGEFLGSS